MKKSIVRISEGLGNQLFMYAHAYSFSKKLGYNLMLDPISAYRKLKIRSFLLDNFNIEFEIANNVDIPNTFVKKIKHKVNKKLDIFRSEKNFLIENKYNNKLTKYEDYTKNIYSNNVYIEGYFESFKYFKDFNEDIINQFKIKKINKNTLFVNPLDILKENSVSIVVRQHRFDEKKFTQSNLNKSNIFLKNTINYILKATEYIRSKIDNPKFYIFSNDTYNLENFFDKKIYKVVNHTSDKAINDFYLSTLCKHFIVGPSTFHWWSAYLGSYDNKICIRPPQNINFSSNIDIYPDNWIEII